MVRAFLALPLLIAAPALAREPVRPMPAARQIFERDWVLMNWALRYFDANGDILIEPAEADAAAGQFRRIADTNRDGRITTQEYRSAREAILARH